MSRFTDLGDFTGDDLRDHPDLAISLPADIRETMAAILTDLEHLGEGLALLDQEFPDYPVAWLEGLYASFLHHVKGAGPLLAYVDTRLLGAISSRGHIPGVVTADSQATPATPAIEAPGGNVIQLRPWRAAQ